MVINVDLVPDLRTPQHSCILIPSVLLFLVCSLSLPLLLLTISSQVPHPNASQHSRILIPSLLFLSVSIFLSCFFLLIFPYTPNPTRKS